MTTPEVFDEIWEKAHYREGSTCLRLLPFLRTIIPAGSVVNDYGSGTGRAEKRLLEWCAGVNMVDFAGAALEDEARALIGERLTYTVAALDCLPEDFPFADWGICINVLMTVDPGKLDAIQREMRRTCRNLIVEVYDVPDVRLGQNRTLVVGNAEWWAREQGKYWPEIEAVKSPEHPRRYITICRT